MKIHVGKIMSIPVMVGGIIASDRLVKATRKSAKKQKVDTSSFGYVAAESAIEVLLGSTATLSAMALWSNERLTIHVGKKHNEEKLTSFLHDRMELVNREVLSPDLVAHEVIQKFSKLEPKQQEYLLSDEFGYLCHTLYHQIEDPVLKSDFAEMCDLITGDFSEEDDDDSEEEGDDDDDEDDHRHDWVDQYSDEKLAEEFCEYVHRLYQGIKQGEYSSAQATASFLYTHGNLTPKIMAIVDEDPRVSAFCSEMINNLPKESARNFLNNCASVQKRLENKEITSEEAGKLIIGLYSELGEDVQKELESEEEFESLREILGVEHAEPDEAPKEEATKVIEKSQEEIIAERRAISRRNFFRKANELHALLSEDRPDLPAIKAEVDKLFAMSSVLGVSDEEYESNKRSLRNAIEELSN
jgi:hypothetical protein